GSSVMENGSTGSPRTAWLDRFTTNGMVRQAHHGRNGSTGSPRTEWFDRLTMNGIEGSIE
ncbi:MAG TPA: hypothetical protein VGH80_01605, partial [Xanthomonadaceae bacterium]